MSRSRTIRFLLLVGLVALGALEVGGHLPVPVSHGPGAIVRADVGRPRPRLRSKWRPKA